MKHASSIMLLGTVVGLALASSPAQAQVWKRVKEKVKEKVNEKVEATADTAVDKGVDAAAEKVKCVFSDKACIAKAQAAGQEVVLTDKGGQALPADQQPAQKAAPPSPNPGEGAWANYDFVPGERVLFKEDFTADRVGNFPQRLELIEGNAEVVTWNGGRWFRLTTDPTVFAVPLPEVLPSRFTMEFQVTMPWWGMVIGGAQDDLASGSHSTIELGCCAVGVGGSSSSLTDARPLFDLGQDGINGHLFNVRIQGDGKYLKVYLEEKRLANIPNADFTRSNKVYFSVRPSEDKPVMFGPVSINAGGTPMYEAIMQNGRFATQGILFDVDSDRIRPESTPTLSEIADMLKSHGDLKILIEGHTDNTGDAAHNQTLSERRAAAVQAYLTTKGGIDGARLSSKGFGASKPAGSNATAEGRQANRRVELVKQ